MPGLLKHLNPSRYYLQTKLNFSYYEYKYLVPHSQFHQIKSILDEFLGDSDPFPKGIVDSIYYDTYQEDLLFQCLNGDADKLKFRIRGYGGGTYGQVHQKIKTLSGVGKYKSKIKLSTAPNEQAPTWDSLQAETPNESFDQIVFNARKFEPLLPSIRVMYTRYRYRAYDYRLTLDSNIEVFSPMNGLPRCKSYACLPYHVLEVKTKDRRPVLPFVGLVKLQQVSFSKFMLGLNLLNPS